MGHLVLLFSLVQNEWGQDRHGPRRKHLGRGARVCLPLSTHPLGFAPATLEQSSRLPPLPMGISRVSSQRCSAFPTQLDRAEGALAGSSTPAAGAG